jgi:hypothetical protein
MCDFYCYDGINILKNELNIQDESPKSYRG